MILPENYVWLLNIYTSFVLPSMLVKLEMTFHMGFLLVILVSEKFSGDKDDSLRGKKCLIR